MKIKIGILGYGNLGKGVELAIKDNDDMELSAIFTRRAPKELKTIMETNVVSVDEIESYKDKIDVLIICGGSATDLPVQTPMYAKMFNVLLQFYTGKTERSFYEINKNTSFIDRTFTNDFTFDSANTDSGVRHR